MLAEITAADAVIEVAKIKAEEEREAAEQFELEELSAKAGRKTTNKSVAGQNIEARFIQVFFYFFVHAKIYMTYSCRVSCDIMWEKERKSK